MQGNDLRVILHIDLDCFYVQVEQKRLKIPRDVPCAVQQWEGLIAVNYAARARGITRHMRIAEALVKCPELRLVHVQTLGGEREGAESVGGFVSESNNQADGNEAAAGEAGNRGDAHKHKRFTEKACLERYRRASSEIRSLVHKLVPNCTLEKVGTDEFFIDVTGMVEQKLYGSEAGQGGYNQMHNEPAQESAAFAWGSVVVNGPLDPGDEIERRLAEGAAIACRIRGGLLSQLEFTSSAGISYNKLLAKIGSALHKPNQQTLIPPKGVQNVMQDLALKKIWGLGGKLGQQLEALHCATAGDVQKLGAASLAQHLGSERAKWVMQTVQGQNFDPVEERERPKSMLAAKSFNPTSDHGALQKWIRVLAAELGERMSADESEYERKAKTLAVHYRGGSEPHKDRSRCCPMPHFPTSAGTAAHLSSETAEAIPQKNTELTNRIDILGKAAWEVFRSGCMADGLPCNRLAIAATNFADLPSAHGGAASIFKFLKRKTTEPEEQKHEEIKQQQQQRDAEPAAKKNIPDKSKFFFQQPLLVGQRSLAEETTANSIKPSHVQQAEDQAAQVAEDPLLLDVDLAEQKRIMKELEMLNKLKGQRTDSNPTNLNGGTVSVGGAASMPGGGSTASGAVKKQKQGGSRCAGSIARFFKPKQ